LKSLYESRLDAIDTISINYMLSECEECLQTAKQYLEFVRHYPPGFDFGAREDYIRQNYFLHTFQADCWCRQLRKILDLKHRIQGHAYMFKDLAVWNGQDAGWFEAWFVNIYFEWHDLLRDCAQARAHALQQGYVERPGNRRAELRVFPQEVISFLQ
jgi:hypothetical protein